MKSHILRLAAGTRTAIFVAFALGALNLAQPSSAQAQSAQGVANQVLAALQTNLSRNPDATLPQLQVVINNVVGQNCGNQALVDEALTIAGNASGLPTLASVAIGQVQQDFEIFCVGSIAPPGGPGGPAVGAPPPSSGGGGGGSDYSKG